MSLDGYLDAVEHFQARGWALDSEHPDQHLEVEVLVAGQSVGRTSANLYRADLEQGGIGRGDHSFVFNFPQPVPDNLCDQVMAQVRGPEGPVALARWRGGAPQPEPEPAPDPAQQIEFSGTYQDETQHPVFILGAARSGTTAVTQALLKATRYQGHYEGHLLDLLAQIYVTLDRLYDLKGDEWGDPHRVTTIRHVPVRFFRDGFDSLIVEAMRSVFPGGWWLDKTPTANMIHISGRLRRIWPNAKFICLKRRAFENAASRSRKFTNRAFRVDCQEWADAMQAWREARPQLEGSALQVDQLHLALSPDVGAAEIAAFLNLDPGETELFRQALAADRPERTGEVFSQVYDQAELGWSAEEMRTFNEICGAELDAFGYSRDKTYYSSDDPSLRIQRI